MSKLLVKPQAPDAEGRIHEVTPETAGWEHVGFAVHKLAAGQSLSRETGDREHCLVLLSGKVAASAGGQDFGVIGGRSSPAGAVTGLWHCVWTRLLRNPHTRAGKRGAFPDPPGQG